MERKYLKDILYFNSIDEQKEAARQKQNFLKPAT